jgi:hypothetical protein
MRITLYESAKVRICVLNAEQAQDLYLNGMAIPIGRKRIRGLMLTRPKKDAFAFLQGRRSPRTQASQTFFLERIGDLTLFQHHQRCASFGAVGA